MGARGGGGSSATAHAALRAGLDRLQPRYRPSDAGYFGERGTGKKVRIIASSDPLRTAEDFWKRLKGQLTEIQTKNRKGFQIKFPDGSTAVFRRITTTFNSPAITLDIATPGLGIATFQRIHFTKKESK